MKIAYIAHPIGGDVQRNLLHLKFLIRYINLTEPNVVPFAPYYSDCVALIDRDPQERERGIKNNIAILTRPGMVDELRLYGNRISEGMKQEIILARQMKIPIVCGNEELWHQLDRLQTQLDRLDGNINGVNAPKTAE